MGLEVLDNNFICIKGWMINQLNLKGNDLLVYAIIYGFTQLEGQKYTGGLQYLADWTNSTKKGVSKNIDSLIDKQLIIKEEILVNGVKQVSYNVDLKMEHSSYEREQSSTETEQSSQKREQSSTNNIFNIDNILNIEKENYIKEKETKHKFGIYKRVVLTKTQYDKLVADYGQSVIDNQIALLDEYIESNNNKNKYTNFNLVLRKSIRDGWFTSNKPKQQANEPDWLSKYVENFENGVVNL